MNHVTTCSTIVIKLRFHCLQIFLSDFVEMLLKELPTFMSAEYTVLQMNYFGGLMSRMNQLMIIQRENDMSSNYDYDQVFRIVCVCFKIINSVLILNIQCKLKNNFNFKNSLK